MNDRTATRVTALYILLVLIGGIVLISLFAHPKSQPDFSSCNVFHSAVLKQRCEDRNKVDYHRFEGRP